MSNQSETGSVRDPRGSVTMNDVPAPLIAGEVDLRDFDYMPLHGERLFTSDTWLLCNSNEKVAALRLWWAAWHQEPAGSLPADDRLLADLAGYGVAVREFQKVKANAMRGWIPCSDGRLYHPIICQIAEDAWVGKTKKATENARDRERKRNKRRHVPPDSGALSAGTAAGHPAEIALKGKGSEEEGKVPSSLHSDGTPVVPHADPAEIGEAIADWNALAIEVGLPIAKDISPKRKAKLRARIKQAGGIEGWRAALAKIKANAWMHGDSSSGWRASFDFMLSAENFTKVMEGNYDRNRKTTSAASTGGHGFVALFAEESRRRPD